MDRKLPQSFQFSVRGDGVVEVYNGDSASLPLIGEVEKGPGLDDRMERWLIKFSRSYDHTFDELSNSIFHLRTQLCKDSKKFKWGFNGVGYNKDLSISVSMGDHLVIRDGMGTELSRWTIFRGVQADVEQWVMEYIIGFDPTFSELYDIMKEIRKQFASKDEEIYRCLNKIADASVRIMDTNTLEFQVRFADGHVETGRHKVTRSE